MIAHQERRQLSVGSFRRFVFLACFLFCGRDARWTGESRSESGG